LGWTQLASKVVDIRPEIEAAVPYPSRLRNSSGELEATTGRPRTTQMNNIHDEPSSLDLGIYEARVVAQSRPLWRLRYLHSATHS